MASSWGTSWLTSWADSWGTTGGAATTTTPSTGRRRKAMYPGGWVPERLYQPPRYKLKKRALKALKELYEDVRENVPKQLQAGLIPADVLVRARPSTTLPPPAQVDFEKLARSLDVIRILIAALEAQREKQRIEEMNRIRRRREEEIVLNLLTEIFD